MSFLVNFARQVEGCLLTTDLIAYVAMSSLYGHIWMIFLAVYLLFITVPMATTYSRDQLLSLCTYRATLNHDQCLRVTQLGLHRRGCRAGNHARRARQAAHSVSSSLHHVPGEIPVIVGHRAVFTNKLNHYTHGDRRAGESAVCRHVELQAAACAPRSSATSVPSHIPRQRKSVLVNCLTTSSVVPRYSVGLCKQPERLSFMVLSAHSIVKNNAFQSLTSEAVSVQPDLICICETFFKAKHTDALFAISGYT